jgi:uncharacterized protein (TIGR00297 family)
MPTAQNPAGRSTAYQACAVIIGLAPAALTVIFWRYLPLRDLLVPAAVAAGFAVLAWLLRAVTVSGALAGFGIAFTLYANVNRHMFEVLFFVFALTWAATRAGHTHKQERGLAEPQGGRTASQVVANLGVGAILLALPLGLDFALVATGVALVVLAEAAADTCASEIGKAFGGKTVLITSLQPVTPGTDGGVSLLGTIAALVAASSTVALAAVLDTGLEWPGVPFYSLAALFGTFVDSLLGATLERRGWLNNDAVNLLSTSAVAALLLSFAALAD